MVRNVFSQQSGVNVANARPSTRGGVVPASAMGRVDRPLTQYGLPTTAKGGALAQSRLIHDRAFWISTLKAKIGALATENEKIHADVAQKQVEAKSLSSLQKEAETMAAKLGIVRAEMSDRQKIIEENMLTTHDAQKLKAQAEEMKWQHDEIQSRLDETFESRAKKDAVLGKIRRRLDELERKEAEIVADMSTEDEVVYRKCSEENKQILSRMKEKEESVRALRERQSQMISVAATRRNRELQSGLVVARELVETRQALDLERANSETTESIETQQSRLQDSVKEEAEQIEAIQEQ